MSRTIGLEWITDHNGTGIFMGEEPEIYFFGEGEGIYELYQEEDYQGIADQLFAESVGLPTI